MAALAVAITGVVYLLTPPPDVRHRLSMGTAYAALVFLVWSLWLGPWNVVWRRPNPVSFDLRRDIGIWAGVLAIVHTGIGLTVHLRGRMWMYFVKGFHPFRIQNNQFGLANYAGLLAALLFLMLLAISNDLALRGLGTNRWKSLQRYAYVAAGLSIFHGILFQLVEKRHLTWIVVFYLLVVTVLGIQTTGFFMSISRRVLSVNERDKALNL
jgi:sulfoxide reductase heme-binding subunit YedZ